MVVLSEGLTHEDRNLFEGFDKNLSRFAGHVPHSGDEEGEEIEHRELGGESLGGSDRDFRPGMNVNAPVRFPGNRGTDDVADAENPGSFAFEFPHRIEGVRSLAGLGHREVQGVSLHDGIAVPELRGKFRGTGYPGEGLEKVGGDEARVVGGPRGDDLNPLDVEELPVRHIEAA